jgi:hypothetical protein
VGQALWVMEGTSKTRPTFSSSFPGYWSKRAHGLWRFWYLSALCRMSATVCFVHEAARAAPLECFHGHWYGTAACIATCAPAPVRVRLAGGGGGGEQGADSHCTVPRWATRTHVNTRTPSLRPPPPTHPPTPHTHQYTHPNLMDALVGAQVVTTGW